MSPTDGGTPSPGLRIGSIVLRVDDLEREAAFWAAAVHFTVVIDSAAEPSGQGAIPDRW